MRKLIRLGVAVALAASGLMLTAGASSASVDVIECDPSPVPNPGVTVPAPEPVGNFQVLGDEDPCAELVRTIVFVGEAVIPNGVNFAGVGDPSTTVLDEDGNSRIGATFAYTGDCVMVDWEGPAGSSAPVVSSCTFGTTNGRYYAPDQPNPIVHPIGQGLEDNSPGYTGLDWAPANQPSCVNSSGGGTSTFTSQPAVPEAGGDTEQWSAKYSWVNSLNNLRGEVWLGSDTDIPGSPGHPVYGFDAKIEAHAHPLGAANGDAGVSPLLAEGTDAACLQKTSAALAAPGLLGNARVGLNNLLIVGTASWRTVIPTIL